jgi:hypothetical protein
MHRSSVTLPWSVHLFTTRPVMLGVTPVEIHLMIANRTLIR